MMTKMTQAEDRAAYELHARRGWSLRRIGEKMGRTHRSIGAAIRRHRVRLETEVPALTDEEIAKTAKFLAWVEEGREHGWVDQLVLLTKKRGEK
jgi:IS30 family transposase